MTLVRIVLCAAMLAASIAVGQTRPGDMIVDVPFAFVVKGQTLPAGHYIVARTGDYHIRISSHEGGLDVITHSVLRMQAMGHAR